MATAPTMTDCNNYCMLFNSTCPMMGYNIYMDMSACTAECMMWTRDEMCNPSDMWPPPVACSGYNTFDCRGYHVWAAGNLSNVVHCNHAAPTGGDPTAGLQCITFTNGSQTYTQNALNDDLCNTIMGACDDYIAGGDLDTCLSIYNWQAGAPAGTMATPPYAGNNMMYPLNSSYGVGNTVQCKRYHGQVARDTPDPHCWHASLGQEAGQAATCGSACDFYCALRVGVCGENLAQCNTNCSMLDYVGYLQGNADATTGNTLDCRIYHSSVAATYPVGSTERIAHCGHGAFNPVASTTIAAGNAFCDAAAHLAAPLYLVALLALLALFH
jgi:hypothetical protein